MLKKKFKIQTQQILSLNKVQNYQDNLLKKSLAHNLFLHYLQRISYLMKFDQFCHDYQFISSYYNLVCINSLSDKVPNKKYLFSRFFINNQYNKLNMSNVLK